MLPALRRQRRLTVSVLGAFVLALLAAMLAAVPTRNALPQQLFAEICTSTGIGTSTAAVVVLHAGHGEEAADAATGAAAGHHADPACALCLAWSAAPDAPAASYRPPAPRSGPLWALLPAPRAERFTARPPPLRGPPALSLA